MDDSTKEVTKSVVIPQQDAAVMLDKVGVNLGMWTMMNQLAQKCIDSGAFPTALKNPAQALVIMQAGIEIGMKPMQAIQSMFFVHGKLCMYSSPLLAIMQRNGLEVEWKKLSPELVEGVFKYGKRPPVKISFGKEDAVRAGLSGGNYLKYPQDMFVARCVSRAAKLFPDLVGMSIETKEVMEDVPAAKEEYKSKTAVHADDPEPQPKPKPEPKTEGEVSDEYERACAAIDSCTSVIQLEAYINQTLNQGRVQCSPQEMEALAEGCVHKMRELKSKESPKVERSPEEESKIRELREEEGVGADDGTVDVAEEAEKMFAKEDDEDDEDEEEEGFTPIKDNIEKFRRMEALKKMEKVELKKIARGYGIELPKKTTIPMLVELIVTHEGGDKVKDAPAEKPVAKKETAKAEGNTVFAKLMAAANKKK